MDSLGVCYKCDCVEGLCFGHRFSQNSIFSFHASVPVSGIYDGMGGFSWLLDDP